MTRSRTLSVAFLAVLVAPAAVASAAPDDGLRVRAIFSGGRADDLAVGEPLSISYSRGKARAARICWTPTPIESPTCASPSAYRAASRAGVQHLRITLSDGMTVAASFRVCHRLHPTPG